MPKAMKISNTYKKQWLACYLQLNGIKVVPTVSWSTIDSFEYCFDGIPIGSCVAVSSIGIFGKYGNVDLFLLGYSEMIKRINPSRVLFIGEVPKEIDQNNIIKVEPFIKGLKRRCVNA